MKSVCSLILLPAAAVAFSSISADPVHRPSTNVNDNHGISNKGRNPIQQEAADNMATSDVVASSWRLALDIGREPLARMPFDWARSGCRMPLVIPTDFVSESNALVPHSDTVSFTGPDGAVVRSISGEKWELSKDEKAISLSYYLPEEMNRRDVYLEAGTELFLSGRVYTKREYDSLNQEYYQAREEVWKAGGEIGDIYDRQNASKKWDEESGKWVKRYEDTNPLLIAQKQMLYWAAKAKQGQKMSQRPDLNEMSDRGSLPGVEGGVYIANGGTVRVGKDGPVCGTWSAKPITGAPASYRS